jgi:ribosomal protein L40E
MDSPSPPPWSYAARAAYFGDRVCRFCDRHNPAGARFCNDCGSPLHLKPCNQCGAVNHHTATNCDKCGAEYPELFTTPEATPLLPAADPTPVPATTTDVDIAASVTQPRFAAAGLRPGWRLLRPGQLLLTAIATTLIVGVYVAYRIKAATPDAIEIASQPIAASELNAPAAPSAVVMTMQSKPVEPGTTAALQAAIPTTTTEAPKGVSARQRPVPGSTMKRASPRQRPVPRLKAPGEATLRVAQSSAVAGVGAPVAQNRKARQRDRWQTMHVSLARCGGDLIARMVCDQRMRRGFCEGRWGEVPECASMANDRGQ